MNFGFFGDNIVSGDVASGQIKKFQTQQLKNQQKKDFRVWADMYAQPFARSLLYKSHLDVARNERRALELAKKPDAGVKAVAEVAKVSDKLVETKQKQAAVKKEIQKRVKEGDMAVAAQLSQADKLLGQKAQVIEGQLANRVSEGVELSKAKGAKEAKRAEVLQKRQAQMAAAPHLASVWKKHDALYEENRLRVRLKHDQEEMKAAAMKAELAQMPKSLEKDSKMERLRKEESNRRVKQELELAKLDEREAGRLDARARAEGMKKIS